MTYYIGQVIPTRAHGRHSLRAPSKGPSVRGPSERHSVRGPSERHSVRGPSERPSVRGPSKAPSVRGPSKAPSVRGPSERPSVRGPSERHSARGPSKLHSARSPSNRYSRLLLAGAIALVLSLGALCAVHRHTIWHQIVISVVRQQTVYNQLYFTAPLSLPSRISLGAPAQFSFEIKRDGPPTSARYTVRLTDPQGSFLLDKQSVRLDARTASIIVQTFRVPVPGAFEMSVTLSPYRSTIEFHGRAS